MRSTVTTGLLIGLVLGALTVFMGITGWYKDPNRLGYFAPAALILEVVGLVWGLRRTAAEGRTYSGQVVAGATISFIAALVVIPSSLLFTTVLYPDYFQQMARLNRETMAAAGAAETDIELAIASLTPLRQALGGFIMTLTTGIMASAVIGLWIRAPRRT